jgi:hypothetical protein
VRALITTTAAIVLGGLLAPAATESATELSASLREAILASIPKTMRERVEAGANFGESPSGRWSIESAQMDSTGSAEAILLLAPKDHPPEVIFFAERDAEQVTKKRISWKGSGGVAVRFQQFAPERALVHVDAGEDSQSLLHWDGSKLTAVWEIERAPEGERRWFHMEDLDDDGVSEVISYVKRNVDVFFADETDFDVRAGGEERTAIDAVAVLRYEKGKWKKSATLLEGMR